MYSQEFYAAADGFTATVAALLLAVCQKATAARVGLTGKDCPILVMDATSK
jgi:hypothetical protein